MHEIFHYLLDILCEQKQEHWITELSDLEVTEGDKDVKLMCKYSSGKVMFRWYKGKLEIFQVMAEES